MTFCRCPDPTFSSDVGVLDDEDDGDYCWTCNKPLPTDEETE